MDLRKLYDERKIIFASSKAMRDHYRELYDENDINMALLKQLLHHAQKQGLHVELEESLPPFIEKGMPQDYNNGIITTALVSEKELQNCSVDWLNAKYGNSNLGYKVSFDLKHLDFGTKRIPKKSHFSEIESYLLPWVKWAERITIVDQYAIIRKENQNALLRFLDFLHREASQLMQVKFVLGVHYTESIKVEDADGNVTSKKISYRGDEAKQMYRKIFQEKIVQHPIFEKIENVQIGWNSTSAKRFLSFGHDSKEIAIPFDKGVSVHFQVNKKGLLNEALDLTSQFSHEESVKIVDYDYESVDF